jgi:hypothetical protein
MNEDSASDSDDGFPEPDDPTEPSPGHDEEEARNRPHSLEEAVTQLAAQQEARRVASLSSEELNFEAASKLGGSVAEQQEVLDDLQAQKSAPQQRQIVDAFERGTEAVAALLQSGVDTNALSQTYRSPPYRGDGSRVEGWVGNTALHVAAHRGRTALVKLLLKCGADASITNRTNKTAADMAAKTKSERRRGKYDRPRVGCAGCLALLEAHARPHGASVASSEAAGGEAAGSGVTSGATSGPSKKPTAAKKRAAESSSAAAASAAAGSEAAAVAAPAAAPAVLASVPAALPAAAAAAAASVADLKIGSRVSVWWADDDAWYAGTVKSCSRTRGVCVVYDHQEGEDDCTMYYESFAEEKWKMARAALPLPPPPPPAGSASSKAQGKKRARA